ncbi:MAG TPA: alpha/beta hydrolase [Acidimicrobiales bacterium]
MTRILLNEHPTWAALPKKKGKTVVLLHGGLSSSESLLRVLGPRLSKHFALAAFDRRGHGRTADTDAPFSYEAMADETIAFLELLKRRVYLIGSSDGANVALLVALRRPDLLKRIVLVGANYHHEGLVATIDFTPESPGFPEFSEKYATHSPDGVEHAAVVVRKFVKLVTEQPTLRVHDLKSVSVPVLIMCGDDDVATLEHTVSMYNAIPESQLAVLPGASHAVLKEKTKACLLLIEEFLRGPIPPVTQSPLRRATKNSKE